METFQLIVDRTYKATAIYNNCSVVVLKGSHLSGRKMLSTYKRAQTRFELLAKHAKLENETYVLMEDVIFKNPSSAAEFCLGHTANGWTLWKTEDGVTMDKLYRVNKE